MPTPARRLHAAASRACRTTPTSTTAQLTKRHVRAITLAALAPTPGALLWDVGAGSGSIAIEWLRAEPTRARDRDRARRRSRASGRAVNARTLGVPQLEVVIGSAPEALRDLPGPDAIFIGGGLTTAGVIDRCWDSLRPAAGSWPTR